MISVGTSSPSAARHVDLDAEESLFCSPPWIASLDATFGWQTRTIEAAGERLPLTAIDNAVGRRIVALPYSDYATQLGSIEGLGAALASLAASYPDYSVSVRVAGLPTASIAGWTINWKASDYRVDCTSGPPAANTSSAFQRGTRKAIRDGVTVTQTTDMAALRDFHRMFVTHRAAKFGVLSPPWPFFAELHARFVACGNGFLLEARMAQTVIAGILVLRHGHRLYYKYGASELNALGSRPNNLLFSTLLDIAMQDHIREIVLGMAWTAEQDAGLRQFKESLGAKPVPIAFLSRVPVEYDSARELSVRGVLREASTLLARAPLDFASLERAGAALFRYFN